MPKKEINLLELKNKYVPEELDGPSAVGTMIHIDNSTVQQALAELYQYHKQLAASGAMTSHTKMLSTFFVAVRDLYKQEDNEIIAQLLPACHSMRRDIMSVEPKTKESGATLQALNQLGATLSHEHFEHRISEKTQQSMGLKTYQAYTKLFYKMNDLLRDGHLSEESEQHFHQLFNERLLSDADIMTQIYDKLNDVDTLKEITNVTSSPKFFGKSDKKQLYDLCDTLIKEVKIEIDNRQTKGIK